MNKQDVFHARHAGLFEPSFLDEKRTVLFGTGSVGSFLAEFLVRAGVRHLRAFDCDVVSAENICRTTYKNGDIGRAKVEALGDHLRDIRPGIDVQAERDDLRRVGDDSLVDIIANSDLVISVTDDPSTQSRIAAISYPRVPALFAGVYAKGTGGEVLFTVPEQTACYDCILGAVRRGNGPDRGRQNYGIDVGVLAAEPALGIDIAHVTVCAAKVALALLLQGTDAAPAKILDPSRNVLFVGNAVNWIWNEPFETLWARTERRERCLCRMVQGSSTADLL